MTGQVWGPDHPLYGVWGMQSVFDPGLYAGSSAVFMEAMFGDVELDPVNQQIFDDAVSGRPIG